VATVRARFGGKVTYAAIPFEGVDWNRFDVVTLELIRSADVADRFRDGVRSIVAQPKPVAITGFGTATWRGAADVAPRSMEIVEYDEARAPLRLNGGYQRDEAGQAVYLSELLDIFDTEGVDSAFVFLCPLQPPPPPRRRPPRRPRPRQRRNHQGPRRPQRRHLPGHAVGAQGRLPRHRRALLRLIALPVPLERDRIRSSRSTGPDVLTQGFVHDDDSGRTRW
jgi:hypothetical protein